MAQSPPLAIERTWREERPPIDARAELIAARRRRLTWLLGGILLLGGVAAGMVSWLQRVPSPYFVPCWITSYRSNLIPPNTAAELDRRAIRGANFFPNSSGSAAVSQDRRELHQKLASLADRSASEAVVVYLSAYAGTDGQGQVYLLTSDSDPDDPASRLSLHRVLQQIAACPARRKLLVLDIAWPIADARLGILANDAADYIPHVLAEVPDPDRLVLTSCTQGQINQTSGALQQSVFGYYFYRGLAGDADGYNARDERNGRVSIYELAAFLSARVDRWASQNRQTRQTPLLHGKGDDFDLVAMPQAEPAPLADLQPVEPYPEWLSEGWQLRDTWQDQQRVEIAPRYVQQLEAALLTAEGRWAAGADPERVEQDLQSQIEFYERQMQLATQQLPVPQPRSLAQAELIGQVADPAFGAALEQMLTKLAAQMKTLPPAKAAAAQDAALQAFYAAQKDASAFDYAAGVIEQLSTDQLPTSERVQTLAEILHHVQPHPQYVETLFLSQLAELAGQLPAEDWPTATVRAACRAVCSGERAASRVRSLPWVRPLLDQALQQRHDGLKILLNPGYASIDDAAAKFNQAVVGFDTILAYQALILDASAELDRAFAWLTPLAGYLGAEAQTAAVWLTTTQAAGDLAKSLVPPSTSQPLSTTELRQHLEAIGEAAGAVKYGLAQLGQPFSARNTTQTIALCEMPAASAAVWLDADAMLAMPILEAQERAKLWNASRNLAYRLAESTLKADRADDERQQQTAALERFTPQQAMLRQRQVALQRASASLAVLRMAGLSDPELLKLQQVVTQLTSELPATTTAAPTTSSSDHPHEANFYADLLRRLWAERLPEAIVDADQLALRNRLSLVFPARDQLLLLEDPSTNPRVVWMAKQTERHIEFLARHFQYEAADGAQSPFYAEAAHAYMQVAGIQPEPMVQLSGPTDLPSLSLSVPSVDCTLTWNAAGGSPPQAIRLQVMQPASAPLEINSAELVTTESRASTLHVGLTGDAAPGSGIPAQGFMVRLVIDGLSFHHLVSVPYLTTARELEILLSTNPKQPDPVLDELNFRALKFWQPLYLYIRNTGDETHELAVELTAGEVVASKLTLGPGKTLPVAFTGQPPQPNTELPEVLGPIRVRLLGAADQAVLAHRSYYPRCVSPREYVRILRAEFQPQNLVANRLSVALEATNQLPGPPCVAELVLPPDRIPGLLGVKGGAFRAQLPGIDQPLTLYAQDLHFSEGTSENGYFYINVDGCERAFVFHATLARQGNATTPTEDLRPRVALVAPSYAVAGGAFDVTMPVDNAPPGARLHLALGRRQNGTFQADAVQPFPTAKHERIGFSPHGKKGELLVEVESEDWSTSLDTSGIVGQRELVVTLLGATGQEIDSASQTVILDRGPPSGVQFVNLPAEAAISDPLPVQIACAPSLSGIQAVKFFCGAPADGKLPPHVPTVPGSALDSGQTLWAATLALPPTAKGPTPISVEVTNAIGLSTFATGLVNVVESLPPKAGQIEGTVVEGPRPQAGLEVVLNDDQGKPKAKTQTKADGTFTFANVPAGNYTLTTAKPSSQRKGHLPVEVQPDATTTVTVPLYLGTTGTAPS